MQKKRLASLTAAAVMAVSTASAVLPASADMAPVSASAVVSSVEAKTCTLKFNANGGKASSTKKTYKKGTKIGTLPVAKKTGYVFDGWFTKKSGGKRINYNTKLAKCKNKTFYAHWKKATQSNLKYKFSNSYEGFGYSRGYKTPYARYRYMFDKAYADWLFYDNEFGKADWGGNCFGMSSTAAFNVTGKTNIHTFNKKATFTKQLGVNNKSSKLKLTVGQYCEAAQLAQYNWKIQKVMFGSGGYENNHIGKAQAMVNRAKKCQKGKAAPVVIGVLSEYGGGHALLGYKVKKVDKYTDRLYVYDCNYPSSSNQYITFYKDSAGNYTRWDGYYGEYAGVTYLDVATAYNVWKNRGKKSAAGMSDGERAYYKVGSRNATVYDEAGNVFCTIEDGVAKGAKVTQFNMLADKMDPADIPVILEMPAGKYTIKDNTGSTLDSSVFYNGSVIKASGETLTLNFTGSAVSLK